MHRKYLLSLAMAVCLAGQLLPAFQAQSATEPWKTAFNRAESYRQQGNFPAALRDYEKALSLNPNAWQVFLARAQTYEKMGMYQRVIENYDQAVALHPRQEQAWLQRAAFFMRRGQKAQALYDLEEGLRYQPYNTALLMARANFYFDRGQTDLALADAETALQANPKLLDAHFMKADCYLKLNNFDAYDQSLSDLLVLAPTEANLWVSRAAMRMHHNRSADAKKDLDKAIALDSGNADAYFLRGQIFLDAAIKLKNPQFCAPALMDFKQACRLGAKAACYKKPPCAIPKASPKAVVKAAPAAPQPATQAAPPVAAPSAVPASSNPARTSTTPAAAVPPAANQGSGLAVP